LCIYLLVLIVGFIIQGESVLFGVRSFLISVALVVLILWMIYRQSDEIFGIWAMIAVTFLIFFFPRILMYLLVPSMVAFPFGQNVNQSTITAGLTYVLLGTAALAAGQILYERFVRKRYITKTTESVSKAYSNFLLLFIIFIIFLSIQIYISSSLAVNPYLLNPRMSTFGQIL